MKCLEIPSPEQTKKPKTEDPRPQTQDRKQKKSRRHIPRPLLSPDTRTLAKIHRCNFEPLPWKLQRQPADMTASGAIPFPSVKPPPTASKIVPGVHPFRLHRAKQLRHAFGKTPSASIYRIEQLRHAAFWTRQIARCVALSRSPIQIQFNP